MLLFSTLLLSVLITIALIPFFRRVAVHVHALDLPDERKVHSEPLPKAGGIAMAVGWVIPVVVWVQADSFLRALLAGTAVIVASGLVDDTRGLSFKAKFAAQTAAALVVIAYGGVRITHLGALLPEGFELPLWCAVPLTLVAIVGVTNAINLADGLDGLAGGIAILIFLCLGYLAHRVGNGAVALMSVAVAGAVFGFLRYNTYPATLFMGDTGSQFLGFVAITLSLHLTQGNAVLSPLLPLLLLGFPVLDTLSVMLERVAQGRSPFVADKNHFHHRLMRLDLSHAEAVLVIYVFQSFLVTSAFVFRFSSEWFLLVFYALFAGLILAGFTIAERTGWRVPRCDPLDRLIKGRLRVLRDRGVVITMAFRVVRIGVPLLLLVTCLLPARIPLYFAIMALIFVIAILIVALVNKDRLGGVLRVSLYLSIPYLVYLSELQTAPWMYPDWTRLYNLAFGVLVVFIILTLKYTKRQKGFKPTPMDALILIVALVVPNLPDSQIQSYQLGLVATKIIVLFFSYEVLMGELRGEFNRLSMATVTTLSVVGLRGLVG
jgi:UDP-GlcNAc:undecaprenyl-phosphate GlcNAc-1-phosphate transferase